jgi:hypothetical protein
MVGMNAHDTTSLQELGSRRRKLAAQLAAVERELDPVIFAAAQAGIPQTAIVETTGLTRETIRRKSMTPEDLEAERAKRRKAK